MSDDGGESFPMPQPSISFLGGPLDGVEMEPVTDDPLEIVYPEWIQPGETEERYYLILPNELPGWIEVVPLIDAFSQVYLWGPYYWTELGYEPVHE